MNTQKDAFFWQSFGSGNSQRVPKASSSLPAQRLLTRCIERGVDVKVIAAWQGHQDGGKLILGTYSHVRNTHAEEMAKRLV